MTEGKTTVLTDTPEVVELKREYRLLAEREETLKDELAAAATEEKRSEVEAEINTGRKRKEQIAIEINQL